MDISLNMRLIFPYEIYTSHVPLLSKGKFGPCTYTWLGIVFWSDHNVGQIQ